MKNVAKTPPMGWNSWDCYGASVTEKELLANADYMAKNLKKYGWEYIVCDIQWYEPEAKSSAYSDFAPLDMDEYGRLIPAVKRFPSAANGVGFKHIADYVHSLGLKFGIHIMRGVPRGAVHANTPIFGSDATARDIAQRFSLCIWNTDMYGIKATAPGAQAYYNSIFQLYAQWGVDFVKVDDICNTFFSPNNLYSAKEEIRMIREAIDNCSRDMVLSLSPGPADITKLDHLKAHANMWRITDDFWDSWDDLNVMFTKCKEWEGIPSENCWPDCDMLPIGVLNVRGAERGMQGERQTRYTKAEQKTLMSLLSIFRSPLMIGGEMTRNDEFTLSLLTNEKLIRILNHTSGATEVLNASSKIIWKTFDEDGSIYIGIFNTYVQSENVEVSYKALGLENDSYTVFDIWENKNLGTIEKTIKANIEPHGVVLFKLSTLI